MAIKDTNRKARANYKKKVKRFTIDFYPTEADLIEQIAKQPQKQTYIKNLIREDMKKD
jgi:hypothetical protein